MNDDKLINLMNDIDESYIDEAMPKRFRRRFPLARAGCSALPLFAPFPKTKRFPFCLWERLRRCSIT